MRAIIDIGTNTVLLLIARDPVGAYGNTPLQILRDEAQISRLGEGLHKNKRFLPTARTRTLRILEDYHEICKTLEVQRVIVAGMSAFRRADDGPDFLQEIGTRFGWETRLLSGDEEARLSYLSVTHDFGQDNLVALDIGGGSTEVINQNGGVSLELGAVVLSEQFLKHIPPTPEEFQVLRDYVAQEVTIGLCRGVLPYAPTPTLVGLAGSVTTLAAIHQGLTTWTPELIQGAILKRTDVETWITRFSQMPLEALRALPGMVKGREDTILAGTLLLHQIMLALQVDQVLVSDRGVRYGLFYESFPEKFP